MPADLHVVPDTVVSEADVSDADVADAVPGTGAGRRVAELRRQLAHHPVHQWAVSRVDRTTLLVHVAFSHWAGAVLAATLDMSGPARQFDDTCRALRRRGAADCISGFAAAVGRGADPAGALLDAGGPPAAHPLVELTGRLVARGGREARGGALILGCPGAVCDDARAGGEPTRMSDLVSRPAAEDAATAMLVAQLALLDGAVDRIRHRHMAAHPSMWQRPYGPPPRLRLLPAS